MWLSSRKEAQFKLIEEDCRGLSQYEYIWGVDGQRTCDHVIRYDDKNARQIVINLLKQHSPSSLSDRVMMIEHGRKRELFPDISSQNLTATLLSMTRSFFWQDMCLLGYDVSAEPERMPAEYFNAFDNCTGLLASSSPDSSSTSTQQQHRNERKHASGNRALSNIFVAYSVRNAAVEQAASSPISAYDISSNMSDTPMLMWQQHMSAKSGILVLCLLLVVVFRLLLRRNCRK